MCDENAVNRTLRNWAIEATGAKVATGRYAEQQKRLKERTKQKGTPIVLFARTRIDPMRREKKTRENGVSDIDGATPHPIFVAARAPACLAKFTNEYHPPRIESISLSTPWRRPSSTRRPRAAIPCERQPGGVRAQIYEYS